MIRKKMKKNPLTKAQKQLLRISLQRLLGDGLLKEEEEKEKAEIRRMVLKDALNAIILE
jgi:hypothetical protein